MDAVFEVRRADGHVWRVYADGRIEGFPDGCVVINRVPLYAIEERSRAESWPTSSPAHLGLAQG